MQKSKLSPLALLAAFVLSLAAPAVHSADKLKIQLNWKPEPEFGGFYAAELAGEYAKRGLDVAVVPGGSGTPTVQMVAAGQAEFGIASADEVVISRDRGSDVVALFAVYQRNPFGVMAHEASGFKDLKALWKGNGVLAIQSGLPPVDFLRKKYGKPKAKLVPYLGGVGGFVADPSVSQQCFAYAEPLQALKQGAKPVVFLFADEGFDPYNTVLIARESWVKTHEAQTKALVQAVRAGWESYIKDPAPANAKIRELNPAMTSEVLKEMTEAQKPFLINDVTHKSGLGTMTEARWKKLVPQLAQLGLIKAPLKAADLFRNY